MRALGFALTIILAGCMAPEGGVPEEPGENNGADQGESSGGDERPVLSSFGVGIAPYDSSTGQAGDILFSQDLLYDDGRVYNDRPFVEFGWTHDYYELENIEYWFYMPLHTAVRAPTSGEITVQYLDHTDDWAVHIDSAPGWTVSFEHVVNVAVEDGQWVDAGDVVADAAPRNTFGGELALVELAVWQGGQGITKHCPADFLEPGLQGEYQARMLRLASDWEAYIGEDIYDEDSWVAPGCLVHEIAET